jgi:hypothetical protein
MKRLESLFEEDHEEVQKPKKKVKKERRDVSPMAVSHEPEAQHRYSLRANKPAPATSNALTTNGDTEDTLATSSETTEYTPGK